MRILLIALLSLGIFFRLAHLDHKMYWYDEAFTSLRAAGYTEAEVVQHFAASGVVNLAELQQFQVPAPDRGWTDTLYSLATEDNQHPPLYYIIAHFWGRWVGSSVAAYRLLPALFSLLGLPAVYWLCQELFVKIGGFPSALPSWVAVGLFAISPFQVSYAQESRQYSLWSTMTLVMTAALLRAMRVQSWASWMLYALTLAASFYTFVLTGLVAIAHAIYVILAAKRSKQLPDSKFWWRWGSMRYLIASLLGTAAFLPWIWVLLSNLAQAQSTTKWTTIRQSLRELSRSWIVIIGSIFYDQGETRFDRAIQLGIAILVGYAFFYLWRRAPYRVWLLIVLLTLVPVLPLLLADLLSGGIRSIFPRYFIPTILGMQLAAVYLLSSKLSTGKPLWRWIGVVLCCASVISGITSFSAPTWWTKTINRENTGVAAIVNQSPAPLLVSDAETGDILALSYLLHPKVPLLIRPRCYTCQLDKSQALPAVLEQLANQPLNRYTDLFFFHPRRSKTWQKRLQANPRFNFEPVLRDHQNNEVLWRIVNKPGS